MSGFRVAETCIKCGNTADTPEGVIYIRHQVDGKWGTHPCCQACWDRDNPGCTAVKMRYPS